MLYIGDQVRLSKTAGRNKPLTIQKRIGQAVGITHDGKVIVKWKGSNRLEPYSRKNLCLERYRKDNK